MAKNARKPAPSGPTYVEKVAAKIIEQMEQGTAPWLKPWAPGELQRPFNPTTGKPYRGGNSLWLLMQGAPDPRWMTYKQAEAEGLQVRKGETGTVVQYVKTRGEEPLTDSAGKPILDANGKKKTHTVEYDRPRVFGAVVFNAQQIDGIEPLTPILAKTEWERHQQAEDIMKASGVPVDHIRGNRACYSVGRDRITMPERDQFPTADGYYATALHELGHATGHPSRLNRDLSNPFGSAGYAKEELRAEIASLMIGERLELGHDPGQHVAYVQSWIQALKDDPREIFRAAADAEKIVDYVEALTVVAEHTAALGPQAPAREGGGALEPGIYTDHARTPAVGDLVSFLPAGEYRHKYGAGIGDTAAILGTAVRVEDTSGGNLRLALETAQDAPQGGGKVTLTVFSQEGYVDIHPTMRANPNVSDVRAGLSAIDIASVGASLSADVTLGVELPAEQWSGTVMAVGEQGLAVSAASGHALYVPSGSMPALPEVGNRVVVTPATADRGEQAELLSVWQARSGLGRVVTPEMKRDFESIPRDLSQLSPGLVGAVARAREPRRDNEPSRTEALVNSIKTVNVNAFSAPDRDRAQKLLTEASVATMLRRYGVATDRLETTAAIAAGYNLAEPLVGLAEQARSLGAAAGQNQVPVHSNAKSMNNDDSQSTTPTGKTYLAVPFAEKNRAKDAGARWDKDMKSWYAPPGADLKSLAEWLPENRPVVDNAKIVADIKDEFAEALRDAGLIVDGLPVMDGTLQRVRVEGDSKSELGGAYKGYIDGHPAGYIQNYRSGEKTNWKSTHRADPVAPVDRERMRAEAAEKLALRDAERDRLHSRAAAAIEQLIAVSPAADPAHKYLLAKGVAPDGIYQVPADGRDIPADSPIKIAANISAANKLREADPKAMVFVAGDLLVPIRNRSGSLASAQTIAPNGRKGFAAGAQAGGGYFTLDRDMSGDRSPIVITEGWATGATIAQATGATTVVAFTAGNLVEVAKSVREAHPDRPIVVAGDNDHRKERETDKRTGLPKANVGKEHAELAAKAVGGFAATPSFPPGSKGSDWNDFRAERGDDEIKKAMAESMLLADRRRLSDAQSITGQDAERVNELLKLNAQKVERMGGVAVGVQRAEYGKLRVAAAKERDVQDTGDELPIKQERAVEPPGAVTKTAEKKQKLEPEPARKHAGGRTRSR